jgi:hypothetical protein
LVGNLFLDSGRGTKIVVAEMIGRSGFKIVASVKDALITALIALKIDILIVDPLIKAHRVTENDNMLMDAVVTMFADIADAANCYVELVQHTRGAQPPPLPQRAWCAPSIGCRRPAPRSPG